MGTIGASCATCVGLVSETVAPFSSRLLFCGCNVRGAQEDPIGAYEIDWHPRLSVKQTREKANGIGNRTHDETTGKA